MTLELGERCLMRENAMIARQKRRFKRTTDSNHSLQVAKNIIDQDFAAEGPNQKWGADIFYVWTQEGWLYLAIILDLFLRRIVVARQAIDCIRNERSVPSKKALVMRCPAQGLIHPSDRGSQYCSNEYWAELKKLSTFPKQVQN